MSARFPSSAAAFLFVAVIGGATTSASAQESKVTYRGFGEIGLTLFPQAAPNDPTHAIADALIRFEPAITIRRGLSASASLEGRIDSHDQTTGAATFWDRTLRRPAFSVRTLAGTFARGALTLEIGKQFVRWGQSDIISPTDHFTPRDYLVPVSSEAIATTAARATLAGQNASLELVVTPRMTPSRMPLLDQRWVGLQASSAALPLQNGETSFPGGPQYGARWHHNTRRVEYSGTFFQGFNHLPLLVATLAPLRTHIEVRRRYPAIRAWGGDAAVPLPGVTIKAEAAWLQSRDHDADEYGLWVVQGERQQAEWLFIGGYVGEWVTAVRQVFSFAPDRGLARSLIGRASYTSDTNRSFVLETVARRNGDGFYAKTEYSHPLTPRWRLTFQFLLIRGGDNDFLGQYERNSFGRTRARFSF